MTRSSVMISVATSFPLDPGVGGVLRCSATGAAVATWAGLCGGMVVRAWFAFVGGDGHGAKFDPLNRSPRTFIALQDLHSVKARLREGLQESLLGERAGNATAPKLRVALQMLRHGLV